MLWQWSPQITASADTFRPLPFLGNAHVQTLLSQCLTGPPLRAPVLEQQVRLPDGDQLVLHDTIPPRWQPGAPVALLVHGLTGCHRSPHVQRTAALLLPHGVRVVRLDLRGAGRGMALARRGYHAGCSDDVRAAALALHNSSPSSPLILVGFSLGGNIVLKLAGEATAEPLPGLAAVVAVAPPIDLVRCSALVTQSASRLYERYFLRALVRAAQRRRHFWPDLPPLRLPAQLTLPLYDDLVTCREWDFAGHLDYYQRASAAPLVPHIQVPAFILAARDDPCIAVQPFEELAVLPQMTVQVVEQGGHLGFLGWDGAGGFRWAERRVVDWLLQTVPLS